MKIIAALIIGILLGDVTRVNYEKYQYQKAQSAKTAEAQAFEKIVSSVYNLK